MGYVVKNKTKLHDLSFKGSVSSKILSKFDAFLVHGMSGNIFIVVIPLLYACFFFYNYVFVKTFDDKDYFQCEVTWITRKLTFQL